MPESRRNTRAVARRIAAAVAFAMPLAACSLVTSLDGLTGGTAPSEGQDTAPPPFDASSPDGAAEATTPDASTDVDSGPAPWCLPADDFCDDFERTDVQGAWDVAYALGGAAIAIDGTTAASPTRSAHVVVPPEDSARSELRKTLPGTSRHVRLRFALKTSAGLDREYQLGRIELARSDGYDVLVLALFPGKMVVAEQAYVEAGASYSDTTLPSTALRIGTWQVWSLELDASSGSPQAIVTVDGVEVLRTALKSGFAAGSPRISLGPAYLTAGPPRETWYDDVAIRVLP